MHINTLHFQEVLIPGRQQQFHKLHAGTTQLELAHSRMQQIQHMQDDEAQQDVQFKLTMGMSNIAMDTLR